MQALHIASKCGYFGGAFLTAFYFGICQLPSIASAATSHAAYQHRENLTEAIFIALGLLLCLLGLFEMDAYRAKHPRHNTDPDNSTSEITESASVPR